MSNSEPTSHRNNASSPDVSTSSAVRNEMTPPSACINPYPVLQVRQDGTLVYGNPASEPLLARWNAQIGQRLSSRWQRLIYQALTTQETLDLQVPVGEQWYNFQIVPLGDGERVNLYGVDISQRYRTELALHRANQQLTTLIQQRTARLKKSDRQLQVHIWERLSLQQNLHERERQLNAIFRQANIGMALLDENGYIIRSNPALAQMLGTSEAALKQTSLIGVVVAEDVADCSTEAEIATLKAALSSGTSIAEKLEVRYRHRSGSTFWGSLGLSAIAAEDNQPQFFVALIEDITDSKLARDALQLTQFAIDSAADAVLWILPSGQFAYVNEAACRRLGYERSQLLERRFKQIAPDFEQTDWPGFWESLRQQQSFTFETRLQHRDGEIFPVDLTLNSIEFNRRQYICAFARDISERKQTEEALRTAQERSERLLLNILPAAIAKELKRQNPDAGRGGAAIAQRFEEVTVLFADIVGFTHLCSQLAPADLVRLLNEIFSTFDRLAQERGLEKIKTIGDAYMAVAGLPDPRDDSAEMAAELSLDMMREAARFSAYHSEPILLRIGLATGPVVAGVIGLNKFSYDLWGDTVNVASRMEALGIPSCIQVTQTTYERLRHRYVFEKRGKLQLKGKGEAIAYLLKERRIS